jgi:glycogen operon protein
MSSDLRPGRSAPLGASVHADGVNFSVFSKNATGVELQLFDRADASRLSRTIALHPERNRTYHYWHVFVPGIGPGQIYGYRAHGPFQPAEGLRFDPRHLLLDPYGLAVLGPDGNRRDRPGDDTGRAMKSVVADPARYDWEQDVPLRRPWSETVIYELHVRGFTKHPSSGVSPEKAGTYAGLIEKIPYLQDLGVTAVELLPTFQFDAQNAPGGRTNYWGYSPVGFFAPHQAYSSRREPLAVLDEFRDMIKALHRGGIEVILDVVFNHTAEGDHRGPTLCFRGFENEAYYLLEDDRSRYANYSGCGNTLNANHPVVRRMIRESLRYWVEHMHVDGFRFDLASILSRDESGHPAPRPPVLFDIESDPVLAGTKLIAEAWDAAGLYQVGSFVGDAWHEWNARFRDDARRFLKSDRGMVPKLAARLLGSPDVYGHKEREPEQSVNFVTCHDGFTLEDLVSYDRKHNEANGEQNRDGADDNASWNCGAEGPSEDPAIQALRSRQIRNFFTLLLASVGSPMLSMGDEMRRSQRGNNNAYCQDNEIGWLDWTLLERHRDVHRFVRSLFRMRRDVVLDAPRVTLNKLLTRARIEWHGVALGRPDWSDHSHSLATTITSFYGNFRLHGIFNAYWEPLRFELPAAGEAGAWRRWLDTSLESPEDILPWDEAPHISESSYTAQARSIAILVLRENERSASRELARRPGVEREVT